MITKNVGGACGGLNRHPVTPTHSSSTASSSRCHRRRLPWPYWLLILNILQTILVTVSVSGLSLNSFISYYEPVYYNTSHLANQVHRSSRSKRSPAQQDQDQAQPTKGQSQFKFQFQAHKKLFRVNLEGSAADIFSPDAEFLSTTGKIHFDTSKVVNGFLEDDSDSQVDGIIRSDGIFDGHIQTKDDLFYIEPAERYFGESAEFPVVIYSHSDVDGPSDYAGGGIGSLLTRRGGFSSLATRRSTILNNSSVISHSLPVSDKRTSTSIGSEHSSNSHGRRSEPLSSAPTTSGHQQGLDDSNNYVSVNQVSSIHPVKNHSKVFHSYSESDKSIVNNDQPHNHGQQQDGHLDDRLGGHLDDYLDSHRPLDLGDQFFENLSANDIFRMSETQANAFKKNREFVSGGQRSKVRRAATFSRRQSKTSDRKKTTCMLYLQADHLFYKNMGRSEEACIEVMTRHVQRVNSIYRSIDFDLDGKPDNISFMIKRVKVHTDEALQDPTYRFPDNYGVEKFLEIFSEEDYDAFCLAYMFTYRDFEGGTLGLAWTGDLKNAGGVCEKNGHYRGSFKSLNTGVITLLNYGKHVPPAVSHVTMAHEMGHNFGSPHDPETVSECVPGGEEGNYIMFARATSGDKMNNKKFSPCSLDSISKVLEAKARGRKGCFKEPQMAICGNGVVEEGEECDCGWEEDCLEDCCWPQRTKYSINQLPCTLKPQKTCSPSQGPCCSRECSYTRGNRCREDNGCRDDSYCNGSGTECPPSQQKPNKTVCNEEFVCFQGECTGSICLAYGMESCQCEQRPGDQDTRSCELCCKVPGEENPCLSSFELNTSPLDIPDMLSKPGTPCNNYQGYCDVFQKCREVDPDGPLATLRKILLSDQSIASLKRFLQNYWYSAVLAVIAIIALMVTIVRFCGKKTPLVHRRRRKRHRSVHHGQDVESGGGGGGPRSLDNMTIHPTTMKSLIPILGGGKAGRRRQSGDRSRSGRSKRRRDDQLRSTQIEAEDSPARKLAKGLANLIVALPPESRDPDQDDHQQEPGDQEQRSHPKLSKLRSKSMEEKSSKYKGNSRIRKHKTIGHMKKLSKSATTLSKSFEKLSGSGAGGAGEGAESSATGGREGKKDDGVGGTQKQRRISKSADKSKSRKTSAKVEPDPTKEVTIAKLGPFKMSMEVRGESMSPGRKPITHQEGAAKASKNGDNNKQRKRRTGSTSKADPAEAIQVDKKDSGENNSDNIKSVQTKVKKEKSRKEKDKVIVSKMAKSDRPHRERSPEKSKELRTINENADYRLSLNKPSTTTSTSTLDRKPNRSISQPNPPSNLAELTHAYYSSSSHSSRISAINKKQLKRSSTAREQLSDAATAERIPRISEKSNTLLRPNSNSKQKLSINNDLTVFDNLGYDKSPSGLGGSGSESLGATGTSGNSSNNNTGKQRQRRVSSGSHSLSEQLREQLESQLRREKNSSNYSLMELTSLSDSDCSSEDKRKSPPTQTQSLSEESSTEAGSGSAGCNTGRRTARNSLVNPFTWEDDNSEGEIMAGTGGANPNAAWPGGPQDVPMSGWEGAKGKGRAGGVEMDDVGWDTEDEGVPQFGASNMFVRLPNSLLLQQSPDSSLQGCELKTDPLNEHTAKPVRVDNINDDIDTISIMTDGMDSSSLNNHTTA